MSCRREDVVAPDPEFESERGEWLATCPHCLAVVFGDSPEAAVEAWEGHEMSEHPPLPESPLSGRELLTKLLTPGTDENRWARWALRGYWAGWGLLPDRETGFTGASFDSLGYVDGADPFPDRFTATDIVAVSMLGVDVPAGTSLVLLDPDDTYGVNAALATFGDRPMHDASWEELAPGSDADRLWHLVRDKRIGTGRTTAGKLLARKRPHLIPVYDSRVAARLLIADTENYWQWWHTWWHEDKPARVAAVEALREAAAVSASWYTAEQIRAVSLLRVLDVALWRYDVHYLPKRHLSPKAIAAGS